MSLNDIIVHVLILYMFLYKMLFLKWPDMYVTVSCKGVSNPVFRIFDNS